MMEIKHGILHVLDLLSGVAVYSQNEISLLDLVENNYITKHIEKIQKDSNARYGKLGSESIFKESTGTYLKGELSFVDYSTNIAEVIYSLYENSDFQAAVDVLFCHYESNNSDFMAILLMYNKTAYTHSVTQDEAGTLNKIIQYKAILPSASQKLDSYATVNLSTQEVAFADRKVYIDGKDVFILPDIILNVTAPASAKDAVRIMSKLAATIAEKNGKNPVETLSKAKTFICENAELSEKLAPEDLSRELFESEELQQEFINETHRAGIIEVAKISRQIAQRAGRTHKIKTDTGIEITFPSEYYQNREYMEFITNPDGTISIELKNINNIINK